MEKDRDPYRVILPPFLDAYLKGINSPSEVSTAFLWLQTAQFPSLGHTPVF